MKRFILYLNGGRLLVLKSFSAASSPQCSLRDKETMQVGKNTFQGACADQYLTLIGYPTVSEKQ